MKSRGNPGAGLEQHSNGLTQRVKSSGASPPFDKTHCEENTQRGEERPTRLARGGKAIDANTEKPATRYAFCFRSAAAACEIYDGPSNCLLTICSKYCFIH